MVTSLAALCLLLGGCGGSTAQPQAHTTTAPSSAYVTAVNRACAEGVGGAPVGAAAAIYRKIATAFASVTPPPTLADKINKTILEPLNRATSGMTEAERLRAAARASGKQRASDLRQSLALVLSSSRAEGQALDSANKLGITQCGVGPGAGGTS